MFIGRHVEEVTPADVAQSAMAAIRTALKSREPQVINYELWEGDAFHQLDCRVAATGSDEVLAVVRDCSAQRFLTTRRERRRERELLESRADSAVSANSPYSLSFREFTVLDLILQGLDDGEIARKLGLSRASIVQHVASILAKLDVKSRTEAAIRAMREGLIPDNT